MDAKVSLPALLDQRSEEFNGVFSALSEKHFSTPPGSLAQRNRAIRDFSREALELVKTIHPDTAVHVKRTARFTAVVTRHFNARMSVQMLSPERMHDLALWHDIGKLCIPEEILDKPGTLTAEERQTIAWHSLLGARLVESVCKRAALAYHDGCRLAADIARSHHERWDGTGYPFGLGDTDIPLAARVVAVADVIEALVAKRSYKPSRGINDALEYIESESGKAFDPRVASAALAARRELQAA